jgi:hypothetical protein
MMMMGMEDDGVRDEGDESDESDDDEVKGGEGG